MSLESLFECTSRLRLLFLISLNAIFVPLYSLVTTNFTNKQAIIKKAKKQQQQQHNNTQAHKRINNI